MSGWGRSALKGSVATKLTSQGLDEGRVPMRVQVEATQGLAGLGAAVGEPGVEGGNGVGVGVVAVDPES